MIIHRSQPESGFVQLPNATVRDPRLSYLARGVLAEMLSRPDDWQESADAIWRRGRHERQEAGEGRNAIRSAFAELEKTGYLRRVRRRRKTGRFGTELHLFDTPITLSAVDALIGVSAGHTDDRTGGGRSDLQEREFPQVAPTYRTPGVGQPGVGGPGVGQPGVYTNTDYGNPSTNTGPEHPTGEYSSGLSQSPVQVEGIRELARRCTSCSGRLTAAEQASGTRQCVWCQPANNWQALGTGTTGPGAW